MDLHEYETRRAELIASGFTSVQLAAALRKLDFDFFRPFHMAPDPRCICRVHNLRMHDHSPLNSSAWYYYCPKWFDKEVKCRSQLIIWKPGSLPYQDVESISDTSEPVAR